MTAGRELSTVEQARDVAMAVTEGYYGPFSLIRRIVVRDIIDSLADAGLLADALPEWEWGVMSRATADWASAYADEAAAQRVAAISPPGAVVVRRRPAGPWEPCPDEETPT